MRFKYLKEFALLAGVIIVAAAGARLLAGGETLSDYAKKNPETAAVSSSVEEIQEPEPEPVKEPEPEVEVIVTPDPEPEIIEEPEPEPEPEPDTEPSPERITYMDGFYYEPISNDVFKRISGISYPVDCTVSLDELRYMGLKYIDFNGETQTGELICNKALAEDMVEIFYELYTNDYRIESVRLVDEYGGDDTASMLANNTSCFNYRVVEGTTKLSNHAYGRAIDLNPFYNPYVTYNKDGTTKISPEGSEAYADRSASFPYKIDENDLAYKLFKEHGFKWGGDWNNSKDYQHFEKK
ncbi:M15 family metallopeptidase [Butyrivibrio sp. XPD2006]|uniref:M15 family metallopeptidase n=1 Tax=Butyrivibrio sp. XPD2006 TaxID=1280668 RepID=UPI0003B5FAF3|nr:M15 family metallopeptidase [Butyrivibrio sp. XPD2006]